MLNKGADTINMVINYQNQLSRVHQREHEFTFANNVINTSV